MTKAAKNGLLLFLVGFFLAPVGDYFHVRTGTTAYPTFYPLYIAGLPFWVFFLFGTASLLIALSHVQTERWFKAAKRRLGAQRAFSLALQLAFFLSIYVLSGFLARDYGAYADVTLALLVLSMWLIFERSLLGFMLAVLTAVVGTFCEIVMVRAGIFSYRPHADSLAGVASWLPWIYFAASVVMGNMGRALMTKGENERASSSRLVAESASN